MVGNTNGQIKGVKFRLVQGYLNTSVSINANALGTLVSAKKLSQIWSSFLLNDITGIADDKVVGIIPLWASGSSIAYTDALVQNNNITVAGINLNSSAVNVTALRLGIIYEL